MNAKSRTARQIIKSRRAEAAAAKRPHTATSHALRAGVAPEHAAGIGNAVRAKAKLFGVKGRADRVFRTNSAGQKMWRKPVKGARRYTKNELALMLTGYNPRAPKFALAKTQLMAYVNA